MKKGAKQREAACNGNLGAVYESLGEYGKAEEYQRKALAKAKEIGAKQREAACYGNLGVVYQSLCEYGKAEENLKKARDRKKNWRQTTRSRLLWKPGSCV